jgi:hypothetical protein
MKRAATVLSLALSIFLASAAAVWAHDPVEVYTRRWGVGGGVLGPNQAVSYDWGQTYPTTTNWRGRATDAANAWNARSNTFGKFAASGRRLGSDPPRNCPAAIANGSNALVYRDLVADYVAPPEALALAMVCPVPGTNQAAVFQIGVSTRHPWWASSSTAVPSREYDLQGVLTHEFGHATGWYWHWDDPKHVGGPGRTELCPVDNSRHTMCAAIWSGTAIWRTLGSHDGHTFDNHY